jgi:hypothetical protein
MCHTCTRRIYCTAVSPSSDSSPVTRTSPPAHDRCLNLGLHAFTPPLPSPAAPALPFSPLPRSHAPTHTLTRPLRLHTRTLTCIHAHGLAALAHILRADTGIFPVACIGPVLPASAKHALSGQSSVPVPKSCTQQEVATLKGSANALDGCSHTALHFV